MKCCNQQTQVTHTYNAGRAGRTRRTVCTKCLRCFTEVVVLLIEDPPTGKGAYAVAKKLRNGEASLKVALEEKGSQPS